MTGPNINRAVERARASWWYAFRFGMWTGFWLGIAFAAFVLAVTQ